MGIFGKLEGKGDKCSKTNSLKRFCQSVLPPPPYTCPYQNDTHFLLVNHRPDVSIYFLSRILILLFAASPGGGKKSWPAPNLFLKIDSIIYFGDHIKENRGHVSKSKFYTITSLGTNFVFRKFFKGLREDALGGRCTLHIFLQETQAIVVKIQKETSATSKEKQLELCSP